MNDCAGLRFGDRFVSMLNHMLEPESAEVHRREIIAGSGRRPRFAKDYKVRVVEEAFVQGAVVLEAARRCGLTTHHPIRYRLLTAASSN